MCITEPLSVSISFRLELQQTVLTLRALKSRFLYCQQTDSNQ